ncbi:hypothetical protein BTS2_1084 [Bacillus sp. TS-2]|nr:hypothetical protein BTS2_1084 [Bacillus sp. TS-2]
MKIQEAYKIFDISKDATEEEIEKHYLMWIKKNKADPSINMEEKSKAYETILNYKRYGTENPEITETKKDKIAHFFRYYKLHTIGVIIGVIIIISVINMVVDHRQEQKELASLPPLDVEIMYYGSFFPSRLSANEEAEQQVSQNIEDSMPTWNRVNTILNYNTTELNESTDVGMQQRSVVILATERPDMYVMDEGTFRLHVPDQAFYTFDQEELEAVGIEEDRLYFAQAEEDTEEKIYGVEISAQAFDGLDTIEGEKMIAIIRNDAENLENALEFVLEMQD